MYLRNIKTEREREREIVMGFIDRMFDHIGFDAELERFYFIIRIQVARPPCVWLKLLRARTLSTVFTI